MPEVNIPNFDQVELTARRLDPGLYMVNVIDPPSLHMTDNNKQYIEVNMKVVEGPDQTEADPATGSKSPVGRTHKDRLYLVDGAYFRVKAILIASGLLARDDTTSPIALGKFNPERLMGTRFQIKLTPNMVSGKEYRNVEYIV